MFALEFTGSISSSGSSKGRAVQVRSAALAESVGVGFFFAKQNHYHSVVIDNSSIAMAVYKRGNVWWFKFNWNGDRIYESTKQSNKRIAEQIEAARKTQLAKGEVGIRDRPPAP